MYRGSSTTSTAQSTFSSSSRVATSELRVSLTIVRLGLSQNAGVGKLSNGSYLRVEVGEVSTILVVGIKSDLPDLGADELDEKKRVIVEPKDSPVAAGRILVAVAQQLIIILVGDPRWLTDLASTRVKALKEIISFDKDVRIAKFGIFVSAHIGKSLNENTQCC